MCGSRATSAGRARTPRGVETVELNAAAGQDLVDIGDLTGTGVARIDADLGLVDGARDTVFAAGTAGVETIEVSRAGDIARVTGLPSEVRLDNAAADHLTIQSGGGNDKLTVTGAPIGLTLEGNDGNDTINVTASGQQVRVAGLAAVVEVNRADPAFDTLHVDTKPGPDSLFVAAAVHQRLTFSHS